MNLKWYRIQKDTTTTFLHEGEGEDDSPGLQALQSKVYKGGKTPPTVEYVSLNKEY